MGGRRATVRHLQTDAATAPPRSVRLHYLDWLRVILLFGVFLYHAVRPFDAILDWHIKNAEQSMAILALINSVFPWGLPLFFLIAGTGSRFSLLRRGNRRFLAERVTRLLIPFVVGSVLLTPLQRYLEELHKGSFQGSFRTYVPDWLARTASLNWLTPLVFPRWGLHLWFLGFLFAYSVLALPAFRWFQAETGQSFISWLGRVVERRGAILLFAMPLAVARVLVQPIVPAAERGWLDFVYYFLFFILGYIIYADDRFLRAVRRDRWLLFGGGLIALVALFGLVAATGGRAMDWFLVFVVPWSIVLHLLFTAFGWCWAVYALYLAMTHLDFANQSLVYARETIMPFYLLHQPVIIAIAFFVVQWDAGIAPKLLVVVLGSLAVTLALAEVVKRIGALRGLLSMKRGK
jgi:peptidoglycan/LPS O-acetylase OafA/YrhL